MKVLYMKEETTLSIIKPDAVKQNAIGQILHRFEQSGLKIIAAKMVLLSTQDVEHFYSIHQKKPFFSELVTFMTSGPILVCALQGEKAITKTRDLMGDTDPKKALPGTIRRDFAQSIDANAVHGSDSPENAKKELHFFFPDL